MGHLTTMTSSRGAVLHGPVIERAGPRVELDAGSARREQLSEQVRRALGILDLMLEVSLERAA